MASVPTTVFRFKRAVLVPIFGIARTATRYSEAEVMAPVASTTVTGGNSATTAPV